MDIKVDKLRKLIKSRCFLSYVADPPRGFASCLEKVMKRQCSGDRDVIQVVFEFNLCCNMFDDRICLIFFGRFPCKFINKLTNLARTAYFLLLMAHYFIFRGLL